MRSTCSAQGGQGKPAAGGGEFLENHRLVTSAHHGLDVALGFVAELEAWAGSLIRCAAFGVIHGTDPVAHRAGCCGNRIAAKGMGHPCSLIGSDRSTPALQSLFASRVELM